jgi:hypothetical protein
VSGAVSGRGEIDYQTADLLREHLIGVALQVTRPGWC